MASWILNYWLQNLQIQPVTACREWFHCPLQAQLAGQQKPCLQPLLAPCCSWVSSSKLRANELTTCLFSTVSISQVSPSCSIAVFSFVPSRAIGCSFPANLILLFPGRLTSPCRFLHTFLLSLAWVTSAIQQVYASNQCWTSQGLLHLSFKVAGPVLDFGSSILLLAVVFLLFTPALAVCHVPWRSLLAWTWYFSLSYYLFSSVFMNCFHHCPLGHMDLPGNVGNCFIIYGSCSRMVSLNTVTSF